MKRRLELGLAALVTMGSGFAAFVPGVQAGFEELSAAEIVRMQMRGEVTPPMDSRVRSVLRGVLGEPVPADPDQGGLGFRTTGDGRTAVTLTSAQGAVAIAPRVESVRTEAEHRTVFGLEVTAEPAQDGQRWWLVAGAEHETFKVSPEQGFRDLNLTQVGGSAAVGDAHVGVAFEVKPGMYASLGYVQERRRFQLGTDDWEEKDHFIGATFHARW